MTAAGGLPRGFERYSAKGAQVLSAGVLCTVMLLFIPMTACRDETSEVDSKPAPHATRLPSPVGQEAVADFGFYENDRGVFTATRRSSELFVDNGSDLKPEAVSVLPPLVETLQTTTGWVRVDSYADGIDDPDRALTTARDRATALVAAIEELDPDLSIQACVHSAAAGTGLEALDPTAAWTIVTLEDQSVPKECP